VRLAKKLGISADDVEKFEDCERVTDMLQDEYIEAIGDEELRRAVRLMKKEHAPIRAQHPEPFARKAESLYGLLPSYDAVIWYHRLEQGLEGVDGAALEQVRDPGMRSLLLAVKHVHDRGHGKRKAQIYRSIVDP